MLYTPPSCMESPTQSAQCLLQSVSVMESLSHYLTAQNADIQGQLSIEDLYLKKLRESKAEKVLKILGLLEKAMKSLSFKQRQLRSIQDNMRNALANADLELARTLSLPIPNFNYTYIINKQFQVRGLSARISVMNDNMVRERAKKQQEIRTYKIKISLAEIELKQLLNRNKKQ